MKKLLLLSILACSIVQLNAMDQKDKNHINLDESISIEDAGNPWASYEKRIEHLISQIKQDQKSGLSKKQLHSQTVELKEECKTMELIVKRTKQKNSTLSQQVKVLKNEIKKRKERKPVGYGFQCP